MATRNDSSLNARESLAKEGDRCEEPNQAYNASGLSGFSLVADGNVGVDDDGKVAFTSGGII